MSTLTIAASYRAGDFTLELDTSLTLSGVTALVGPSGSGKTTLLDAIAGLRGDLRQARIALGTAVWQDDSVCVPSWRRPLAYVFQDARLFPHLDVRGNLDFARHRAANDAPRLEEVVEWMAIGDYLDRDPGTLSAGQRQRVAIARALLRGPELLLLDEPLANLDDAAAAQCLRCLRQLSRESGIPMLYVSHQIDEVAAIADELILLRDGRIQGQGPLLEMLGRLDTEIAIQDSAATLLRAQTTESDERYGLAGLAVDGQTLWVAADNVSGERQRLRVPARDVSVCRERPVASSILNILEVTLVELRDLPPAHCLLRLQLAEQHLLARITRRSRDELKLAAGDRLFAQIKSTALLGDDRT